MPLWLIPMVYTVVSLIAGVILPRVEQTYLSEYTHSVSVSAALAFCSAVSSGMMALTGIVFAIAFVTVQFSALAYSPRLVIAYRIRNLSQDRCSARGQTILITTDAEGRMLPETPHDLLRRITP